MFRPTARNKLKQASYVDDVPHLWGWGLQLRDFPCNYFCDQEGDSILVVRHLWMTPKSINIFTADFMKTRFQFIAHVLLIFITPAQLHSYSQLQYERGGQ